MRSYRVKGDSMHPFLRDGDFVLCKETPYAGLRKGNLLVFIGDKGEYVIHRLVDEGSDGLFYLKGDGYKLFPEPVARGAIKGRAVGLIRGGRFIPFTRLGEWSSWAFSFLRNQLISAVKKMRHGA